MTDTVIATGSAAERIKIGLRRGPAVRQKMSGPALRTFFAIGKAWNLSVNDRRGLLGWPSISTFDKYEAGDVGQLDHEMLLRISYVIGIYKALHILYDDALADCWPTLHNSNQLFAGHVPLALMVSNDTDGLHKTRRLLDARILS